MIKARFLVSLRSSFGLGSALILLTAALSFGQILQNGSFETDYTGWIESDNQSIATNDSSHPASEGSKVDVFSPGNTLANAVLFQNFATTPGQRYGLAFDLGTVGAIADQRMEVILDGNGNLLDQILVVAGPDAGPFYIPQHITFVANSANTKLTFKDASITYYVIDLLLDHVEITPEDAQWPLITSQPQRTSAARGGSATFSVTASGADSYQWRFNGVNIGGANSSSYTVNSVQNSDAGNYDVVVSNASPGSVTSSAATLTVLPPAILLNGSFEYGSAAWSFTRNVAVSTNVDYGVTDGAQLVHFNFGNQTPDGVLSQSFATTNGQAYVLAFDVGAFSKVNQDEQRMHVTVQGNGTLLSQTLSVFAPRNGSQYVPESFVFVADNSTTTLTFQDISPTTDSVDLLLDNVRVTVQNAPVITSQPQSLTAQPGNSATFSVTASGQPPLSYQWRFNGGDIAGANSSSYTINSVQNSDAGNYDVVVSNASDSVTSATALLTVSLDGILANGSFEYDYAAWSETGNQQVVSTPDYQVTDGAKAVVFNAGQSTPNAVLTQNFATTAGQSYVLSFDLGSTAYQSSAEQRMQVTVQGNSVLVSQTASIFAQGTGTWYTSQSFAFVADSATTTLRFQDVSPTTINIDLLLDNVRVISSLQLTSAVSRKAHGGAGTFDINLPLSGEPGVECRSSGGNHIFVFTFTNNVVSGSATVTGGEGSAGSPAFAGKTMTVNLTGVADMQKITVTLSSVTDNFGQVLPTKAVSANMLIGDTTGNKSVNSSDISQTKAQSGIAVNGTNFREDLTVSGAINSSDISLVKANSGHAVP
jgi:hypothetical protein